MDKKEVIIGRQVERGDYQVDEQYKSVGRKHARLLRKQDGLYIEDLDSSNGTFVNGKSVKLKRINVTDRIMLGGQDYYELNIAKALKLLPISNSEFREGFMRLKGVYDTYQTESTNLQMKGQDMMTKRMLPSMIMGVITGVLTALVGNDAGVKTAIGITGSLVTVSAFFIISKVIKDNTIKNREKTNQLNENFELDYVCPACGVSFRGRSWEFLNRDGKCPACKREFNA